MNTLCGFLEQCSTSPGLRIRHLSYKTETWTRAFNIYLTKSDSNKSKPLRRLLLTLGHLVSNHPVDTEKNLLLGIAISIVTRAIRKQDDHADIKPAIQVLEHFLSRGLIYATEVAQVERQEDFGRFRMMSMRSDNQNSDTEQGKVNQSVQTFAIRVLEWMRYPDCAPAVGRFLPAFFKSHEKHNDGAVHTSEDGGIPLWIKPLKQTLERHQGLLEVFEIHILPGLLLLGPRDIKSFLKTLPFDSIQSGNPGLSSVSDIQLCLLVAKIAKDSTLRKYFGQGQSTSLDSENLGISLLEHPSSIVRVAALSLLVSSSASSRPFCRRVLRRLQQCLPYFHIEVNAKPRNEFIALMKKLSMRLRGATMSLLRRGQDPNDLTEMQTSMPAHSIADYDGERPMRSGNAIEHALDEKLPFLEDHLAFRRWYMVFLLQELRPTASYQSHITALKILNFLMEQTMDIRNTPSKSNIDYLGALNEHLPKDLFLRALTELLLDPFDDVRQSANTVFDLYLSTNSMPHIGTSRGEIHGRADLIGPEAKSPVQRLDNEEQNRKVNHSIFVDLHEAEKKMRATGRADHADGFARLNYLLFATSGVMAEPAIWHQSRFLIVDRVISTLEQEVGIAKDDLLFAVSSRPLHGHLIALR